LADGDAPPKRGTASHHRAALPFLDEKSIRRSAVTYRVPGITTMSGARAAADAIIARARDPIRVWSGRA
jgi:hypothetical protein